MSGSEPRCALGSTVIAADPSKPFTPQPVISGLLRTRHCVQGSVFLVEGIQAHIPISKRYRTVRLLLGDGDFCIQALLRTEMHRFVDHGSIFVGGYVQLNKFELRAVPSTRPGGQDAPAAGETTEGAVVEEMVFLVVWDMVTVGWNTAFMQMAGVTIAKEQQPPPPPPTPLQRRPEATETEELGEGKLDGQGTASKDKDHTVLVPPRQRAATQPAPKILREKSNPDAVLPEINKDTKRAQQQPITTTTGPGISYSAGGTTSNLPWAANDLTKPLKLTPLKSIPNLPYKQNWVVNILAVVASLSEVEAATLPPFKQRTARLADPSTSKQVLLTVFLDPDDFAPRAGSVVLLLGVKNHRFDGGCLKKYGNEKPKPGSKWWFENPRDIEWCDVDGLSSWWAEKSLGSNGS